MGFDLFNPASWIPSAIDWGTGKGTSVDIPFSSFVNPNGITINSEGIQEGSGGTSPDATKSVIDLGMGLLNYNNQQNQQNEQRGLNALTMSREDNAIQRRVADAKKAGIHPLAVLGSGAGASNLSAPTAAQIDPNINPFDKALEYKAKINQYAQSTTQTKIASQQLRQHTATADIEQKKAQIFKDTGILPGTGLTDPFFLQQLVPKNSISRIKEKVSEYTDKEKRRDKLPSWHPSSPKYKK